MSSNKKYGLILPEKAKCAQPSFQATRNVFGEDSESDDESNKKPILLRPSDNINRQSKLTQERAIQEDPTVYQYDEIYDSMSSKKEEKKIKSKIDKKPKYIENLLKAADKRKIENERRLERQIQKERENEGDEFADKEVFVTSAYKKKLEELRKEEENEKYEEYLESIGDVTKQKDLGKVDKGFYRHLYEQKLGTDKSDHSKNKQDSANSSVAEEKGESKFKNTEQLQTTKKRNYRKRKSSTENNNTLSDGEIEDSDEEINRCNLEDIRLSKKAKQNEENIDADSDFSIDESSDDEKEVSNNENTERKSMDEEKDKKAMPPPEVPVTENAIEKKEILPNENTPIVKKINIWKKRTVGEVFDQALIRYYERKARRA